ncbi:MAG TPA: DNA repair protein RecN [Alphaproteobacteria bacterium]|nr:DNA repair protein RecN [Alphaproteobacteria bacterium]
MLLSLSIRDVVLIDRLDLSFHPGLCVLTGETGAGKSILLDALGLALGARADAALVRHGATQASVTAAFEPARDHAAWGLLAEQGIAEDEPLVLRRVLAADGRSRAFVNEQPVTVGFLRQLGDTLVEIQGQLDQHGLLDPATHRAALDAFGGHAAELERLRKVYTEWREAEAARARFEAEVEAARRDEETLRHAVDELDRLAPQPGEEAQLAEERMLLMHREKIVESLNGTLALLMGEGGGRGDGAEQQLRSARRLIERAAEKAGGRLDAALAALDRASLELGEALAGLQTFGSGLDTEPGRLAAVDERLYALRDTARKHRVSTEALPSLRGALAAKLAAIDERSGARARIEAAATETRAAYTAAAEALSKLRARASRRLDRAIADELPPLRLEKARFQTMIEPLPESDWGPNGTERVGFTVATNSGAPLGPIAKIASGGELARFMLALKVVLSRAGTAPTLVFDEVDSGIGGATAAAVGERLARLGRELQVLVVTHSPQVAARGAHHWHVAKSEAGNGKHAKTVTTVEELAAAARREEIARMLSGRQITDEARAAADRLIAGNAI